MNKILSRKILTAFFTMIILSVLLAVSANTHVGSFTLSDKSISGYAGESFTLGCLSTEGKTVKFSSTNKSVCTVNSNGVIKFLMPGGKAKIKVVCGSKTLYASVTVKNPTVSKSNSITGKYIKSTAISAFIGEKYRLTLSHTGGKKITFSSSNKKICKVSSKGQITAVGSGTAKVTVKCGKFTKAIKVTVIKRTLTVPQTNLYVNEKETIKVSQISTSDSITWTSSNKSIVSIKSQYRNKNTGICNIVGLKAGKATLTGISKLSGKTWKVNITVYASNETRKLTVYANNVGVSNSIDLSKYISLKPGDKLSDVTYEIYEPGVSGKGSLKFGTLNGSVYTLNNCNIIRDKTSTNWVIARCGAYCQKFIIAGRRWIAHRGLSAEFPENTATAFTKAAEAGAYAIETDICVTADGQFVCFHNGKVNDATDSTGDKGGYVWNFSKDVLLSDYMYSVSYLKDNGLTSSSTFTDSELTICTFEQYLQICKRYNVWPQIDIKHFYSPNYSIDGLAEDFASILKKYGYLNYNCSISTEKQAWLTAISKACNYKVAIAPKSTDSADKWFASEELTQANEYTLSSGYVSPSDLPNTLANLGVAGIGTVSADGNYINNNPVNN